MWRIIIQNLFLLCILTLYFVRSQEEECTVDGKKGRCVELKRCLYVIQLFMENKKPQLCNFKGDVPYVCCTDCQLVEDINQISVDPQRGLLYKDGKGKSWDYCLDQLKSQPYPCKRHYFATLQHEWVEEQQCHNVRYTAVGAAGGVDARRGEVPHAALLGYGSDDSDMQWLCGGTLINDRFILTAGHCISSPTLGPVTTATLGILKRTDPEQLWRKHKIQEIIKHPHYNPPSKYNDIALLKTETNIKFSEYILPACLPNHKTRDFEYAYAVGWGTLGPRRGVADVLQKVIVEPFSSKECTALFEPSRLLKQGFNTSTQQCWGSKSSIRDTCQGDSGGPLYQSSGCQDEVIGVTSYGRECGVQGEPGVYTRVAHYVPWIESVAWA